MALSGANQALLSTSGITLNSGGSITLTYADSDAEKALDRLANGATITSNGGTINYTTTTVASTRDFAETLGTVALTSGQLIIVHTIRKTAGTQTLTLSDLTHAGNATINFGAPVTTAQYPDTTRNIFLVTTAVGNATPNGQIIGPWATVSLNNSMRYAVYNALGQITADTLTTPGESGWSSASTAYNVAAGTTTLMGNRTAAALKHGGGITVDLGNFNLETRGWIHANNGGASTLQATGSGSLTTPTGGGNLYCTIGWAVDTISAPIINNGGDVTVVASLLGASTSGLTLSGANTFSGGVVINGPGAGTVTISSTGHSGDTLLNGGKLTITSDANLGTSGNVTFNGSATLVGAITFASGRTFTLNNGAIATLSSGAIVNGPVTGNGGITVAGNLTLANTGNDFTGPLYGTAAGTLSLANLGDAAGAGVLSLGSAATAVTLQWTGAAKTLNNRQFVLPGTTGAITIKNDSTTGALTINTDLGVPGLGSKTLTLGGSYTGGANAFAGRMADPLGYVLSLTKADAGTWVLSGPDTFSGATTVSGGTLGLAGSKCLSDTALLTINGGILQLNTGVKEKVGSLKLGTTTQLAGTYGSTTSAADNKSDTYFSGTGVLYVGVEPPIPPPPGTVVLVR
jgi:autotransporter-associated beta strand protein